MNKTLKVILIIITVLIAGYFIVYFSLKFSADTNASPKVLQLSPTDNVNSVGLLDALSVNFNQNITSDNFKLSSSENIAFLNELKKDNLPISARGSLLILDEPHKFLSNKTYTITLNSNDYFTVSRKKTKSFAWTFSTNLTNDTITQQENEWQNLIKNQSQTARNILPLDQYLENGVYQTEHFRIQPAGTDGYSIMLFVPFDSEKYAANDENTKTTYYNNLKAYKNESIDWIKSKGADPVSLKLTWVPQEANQI